MPSTPPARLWSPRWPKFHYGVDRTVIDMADLAPLYDSKNVAKGPSRSPTRSGVMGRNWAQRLPFGALEYRQYVGLPSAERTREAWVAPQGCKLYPFAEAANCSKV